MVSSVVDGFTSSSSSSSLVNVRVCAAAYEVLLRALRTTSTVHMACLFILRLMVLQHDDAHDTAIEEQRHALVMHILSVIHNSDPTQRFQSVPALVMALCTMSNYLSTQSGVRLLLDHQHALVVEGIFNAAAHGLGHERKEVRQMAAALLFNATMICTQKGRESVGWHCAGAHADADESCLHHLAVQTLLACVEGLSDESDATARYRKLATMCMVTRACGEQAGILLSELDCWTSLQQILSRRDADVDADQRSLLSEILQYAS